MKSLNIDIGKRGSREPCPIKKCTVCKDYKPESNAFFGKKTNGKLVAQCKECQKEYQRQWYEINKTRVKKTQGKYHEANKELLLARTNAYRNANRAKVREWDRTRYRNKMDSDTSFKVKRNLRPRIYSALRGFNKSEKTAILLGCSIGQLKTHIESQFKNGMSWDNYGEWHVDHIRPCASFDLADPGQQKQCFHCSNLQPLWAKENISKGPKWAVKS